MKSLAKYASLCLLLAACSREQEHVVVEYRLVDSPGKAGQQPKKEDDSLIKKASKYVVDTGLARKIWEQMPEESKWGIIKSVIDSQLSKLVSDRLNKLEDNFSELYNFLNEKYEGLKNGDNP